ncbi:molybdopterin-dependent oxidoreductase [Nocardioides iriomotensis]|uniref:molybdopterin-dependent oxidoreductase n=1 Tax=Nocardioides iriomotensis TaxID=715784 RepID=UPI001F0E6685|nr:molybdopterin-dependent oxidoreductase [Nocardioides iriomotensis]
MTTEVRRSRWYLALAGAIAGGAGVAVAHALTNLLNARATPIQSVAEVVIAITPGPVAELLIGLVGRNDKPILVAGVTLAVLGLGALAGVLSARSRVLPNLVFLAMFVLAFVAALVRPGFTAVSVLPLAAGAVTWVVLLAVLVDAVPEERPAEAERPVGSRRFVLLAGATTVLAIGVGVSGRFFGRSRRAIETTRRLLRLPATRGVAPAGAEVGLAGLTPWRVPNNAFYRIDTALVLPAIDPTEWRLRVHGMVDREVTLTYQDLLDTELTEAWVTLCCVSNEVGGDLIGNAWWSGVRIADVLARAGVSPDADAVKQTSADGWTCGTPIEALTDGRDALLAVAMNGRPLPVDHGFPVRMVVPGLYGFVSATKWVVDLEVTRFDKFTAYWTERGWSAQGPVKTQSRIEVPRNRDEVASGRVRVGGQAWAQHTGIERVEVRLDGNAWAEAVLGGVPSTDTWVQWSATLDVPPGDHTLAVRATDKSGYTQTAAIADVVPDGATGWHTIGFTAS